MNEPKLPPLPSAFTMDADELCYTADQMRQYATEAVRLNMQPEAQKQEIQGSDEPVAYLKKLLDAMYRESVAKHNLFEWMMASPAFAAQAAKAEAEWINAVKHLVAVQMKAQEYSAGYTAPQPTIPPGYKLVPVEPTNGMVFDGAQIEGALSYDLVVEIYRAMLAAAPEAQPCQPLTCEWHFEDDDSGTWASGCGELWSFIDGGPAENRVRYCHGCGKPVAVTGDKT